jgi:phenylpropionate dioxygenase-like ring-hydroxylating dioxygenase large terminal subunit
MIEFGSHWNDFCSHRLLPLADEESGGAGDLGLCFDGQNMGSFL